MTIRRSSAGRTTTSARGGVILIAVGGALALAATGLFVGHRTDPARTSNLTASHPPTTVMPAPAPTAIAPSPPTTAPTVTGPAPAPAPALAPSTSISTPDPVTSAPSPASTPSTVVGLPQRSATLDQLPVRTVIAPTELRIDSQRIDAPVVPVSAAPEDGELVIPATATQIAWYQYGAAPGDPGSAVLAAHVDWHGDLGVFYNLRRVAIGAPIDVTLADGRVIEFFIDSLEQISKAALPTDRIFRRDGPPQLVLITCGGHFDHQTHHYDDNVIVFASLA
jgi:hypothetical protein